MQVWRYRVTKRKQNENFSPWSGDKPSPPNLFSFFFLFYRTCAQSIQRTSDITELDVSKRCKDLASFMENLLQEMKTPGVGKDGLLATDELRSFSVTISYVLVSSKHCYLNYLRYNALRSGMLRIIYYIYTVEILICVCVRACAYVCVTITCSHHVLPYKSSHWYWWKMLVHVI